MEAGGGEREGRKGGGEREGGTEDDHEREGGRMEDSETYNIFGTIVLFIPPSDKECHLHPVEGPIGVVLKLLYDSV